MFDSVRHRQSAARAVAVDIAPLIDIVFILLIFFLVTTTFVRDTGIEVDRPQASHAAPVEPTSLRVSIAPSGAVYLGGREIALDGVSQEVRAFVQRQPDAAVIVIPDERVPSGRLVAVMDAAKEGGAEDVAVATRKRGAR
ncbi:MAG: ExbD/TolR family protein [Phycisphaeraceae bacterium]